MFSHLAEGPGQTHTTQDHCTVATGKEQETILCENQDDFLLLHFRVITHWCFIKVQILTHTPKKKNLEMQKLRTKSNWDNLQDT